MEIKYLQLRGLFGVLDRIKKECRLPVVKALHLKRIIRDVAEEAKLYDEAYREFIERHAKRDEKGEKIINNSDGREGILIADVQAFNKDINELHDQAFEIDDRYIDLTIEDLNIIQLTVEEIDFLEPILSLEEELPSKKDSGISR